MEHALLKKPRMREIGRFSEPLFTAVCTRGHSLGTEVGMRSLSLCALWLLLGCADHDQPPAQTGAEAFQPLVELADWSAVAREDDPFVDAEAPPASCVSDGVRVEQEQSWLELDTTDCGWITVGAEARLAVSQGQKLQLELSHFDLDAAEPATAELRLAFDGCEVWSDSIAIPSRANVYDVQLDSTCGVAPGGQVLFHLHNHGQNTYQLRGVAVLR